MDQTLESVLSLVDNTSVFLQIFKFKSFLWILAKRPCTLNLNLLRELSNNLNLQRRSSFLLHLAAGKFSPARSYDLVRILPSDIIWWMHLRRRMNSIKVFKFQTCLIFFRFIMISFSSSCFVWRAWAISWFLTFVSFLRLYSFPICSCC